jgi:uncharacterized protein (TIGR00369 family)
VDNRNPHRKFGLVSPEVAGRMSGVEFLQRLLDATYPAPPFSEVAEVWPISVEVGRVAFEASPSARFYNPMGLVHGGWLALLLDSAMGCAVHSTLEPGQAFTTIEMKTTFVRPVRESTGKLRCEGVLLHAGSRIASSECKIFDGAGRLIAHGSETCLISTIRSARGAAAPPMQAARSPTTRRASDPSADARPESLRRCRAPGR